MRTLSKIGRRWICIKLGMRDTDTNIFINDQEAFCDRMELFRNMYNTNAYIDKYKLEMEKFESEEAYSKFLDNALNNLRNNISKSIDFVNRIENILGSENYKNNLDYFSSSKIVSNINENDTLLRIYFDYPMYEGYKYLCNNIINLEDDVYDYIFRITNSEFLSFNTDLDVFINDKNSLKKIETNMILIAAIINNLVSPRFLNSKELKMIGKAETIFLSSKNKPAEHVNNIIHYLENNEVYCFKNINVEVYNSKKLAYNSDMKIKNVVNNGKENNPYNIIDYTQYDLIKYLRKLYNEKSTKYDSIVEIGDTLVNVIDNKNLVWHNLVHDN